MNNKFSEWLGNRDNRIIFLYENNLYTFYYGS